MAGSDFNPYAPPAAPLVEAPAVAPGELAETEAVRRRFLSHETSVRSIGSLHYLAAILSVLALFIAVASVSSDSGGSLEGLLTFLAAIAFHAALGYGLDRLRPWARWTEAALVGLSLLSGLGAIGFLAIAGRGYTPRGVLACGLLGVIPGYVLYLLLGWKGTVVFSDEYQDVIALTPHLKPYTSLWAWGCLLVVVAVPAVAMIVWSLSRL